MAAMSAARPERVVNLSYFIGSDHAPHVAMKLNILGMDNCFEVARLLGVKHTMYASSLAVNGKQANYGNRPVTEDDRVNGEYQYAKHKIVNEWQAQDFTEKFGMLITVVDQVIAAGLLASALLLKADAVSAPPTSLGRTRCAARSIT
jgi:nucleoside-diphosphate-sugar epimerase